MEPRLMLEATFSVRNEWVPKTKQGGSHTLFFHVILSTAVLQSIGRIPSSPSSPMFSWPCLGPISGKLQVDGRSPAQFQVHILHIWINLVLTTQQTAMATVFYNVFHGISQNRTYSWSYSRSDSWIAMNCCMIHTILSEPPWPNHTCSLPLLLILCRNNH